MEAFNEIIGLLRTNYTETYNINFKDLRSKDENKKLIDNYHSLFLQACEIMRREENIINKKNMYDKILKIPPHKSEIEHVSIGMGKEAPYIKIDNLFNKLIAIYGYEGYDIEFEKSDIIQIDAFEKRSKDKEGNYFVSGTTDASVQIGLIIKIKLYSPVSDRIISISGAGGVKCTKYNFNSEYPSARSYAIKNALKNFCIAFGSEL